MKIIRNDWILRISDNSSGKERGTISLLTTHSSSWSRIPTRCRQLSHTHTYVVHSFISVACRFFVHKRGTFLQAFCRCTRQSASTDCRSSSARSWSKPLAAPVFCKRLSPSSHIQRHGGHSFPEMKNGIILIQQDEEEDLHTDSKVCCSPLYDV